MPKFWSWLRTTVKDEKTGILAVTIILYCIMVFELYRGNFFPKIGYYLSLLGKGPVAESNLSTFLILAGLVLVVVWGTVIVVLAAWELLTRFRQKR